MGATPIRQALRLNFDSVASDIPIVHTLAPLVLGIDWVLAWFIEYLRTQLNKTVSRLMPFDRVSC
jgi:hypothetical protein